MRLRHLIFAIILMLAPVLVSAQKNYKVVFDLTTADTNTHHAVIRWIREILTAEPTANLEVVLYAQSLPMVTKNKSIEEEAVKKYAAMNNVKFKVCAIALKNNNVDKADLLPGVETVPDGIYEIISKQREGWGYIKASR